MLTLDNITIAYTHEPVVSELSLTLSHGQIGCLLGPSGCGKSSILRAIAGFEPVRAGEIQLRGNTVSKKGFCLPPEKRHVAVVFQDFALFPHLTVASNIAFGLHKQSKAQKRIRVNQMLELVGLSGFGARYPHHLSGGQQQRVALARALAPKPDLLLLDEPFSSLDVELRADLARDIREILKHEQATALMVTHDQDEAYAMADVIGVVNEQRLHQWADAYSLYHQPATRFVADFVGNGVFITSVVQDADMLVTDLGHFSLNCTRDIYQSEPSQGKEFALLVRPDDIVHDDDSKTLATVKSRVFKGAHVLYELDVEGQHKETVLCLAPSHHDHKIGECFGIRLDLEHLVLFDK